MFSACNKKNKNIPPEVITSIEKNESIKEIKTAKEEIIDKEYIQRWSVPGTESELKIKEDGTYSYGHPIWDGPFAFGKCLMKDRKLLVLYPDSIDINESNDTYKKHDLEVLFKNKESVLLEYDGKYMDFNSIGCLRTGDMIINNFYGEESPANKIYIRKGINVKKLPKYSFIISSENMKLREEPSGDSAVMTFTHGWKYKNFPYNMIPGSKNVVWLKNDINLLLRGYAVETIASTEEETEIDGISAPWYLILDSAGDEDPAHEFWIWGGYAKLIQGDSYYFETSEEDKAAYLKACIEQGIIKLE